MPAEFGGFGHADAGIAAGRGPVRHKQFGPGRQGIEFGFVGLDHHAGAAVVRGVGHVGVHEQLVACDAQAGRFQVFCKLPGQVARALALQVVRVIHADENLYHGHDVFPIRI